MKTVKQNRNYTLQFNLLKQYLGICMYNTFAVHIKSIKQCYHLLGVIDSTVPPPNISLLLPPNNTVTNSIPKTSDHNRAPEIQLLNISCICILQLHPWTYTHFYILRWRNWNIQYSVHSKTNLDLMRQYMCYVDDNILIQ